MHVHGHILHIVMQVANKTKRVSFFTIVPFRFLYSLIVLNLLVNYIIHTIYLAKKGPKISLKYHLIDRYHTTPGRFPSMARYTIEYLPS